MLKPEQIPDEVVEAAVAMRDRGGSMSDIIRTALNAWPGMSDIPSNQADGDLYPRVIHLPLPQEAGNEH